MAQTVTVQDNEGNPFRCTRNQWEALHQPAGLKLLADENGDAPKPSKTAKAEPTGD